MILKYRRNLAAPLTAAIGLILGLQGCTETTTEADPADTELFGPRLTQIAGSQRVETYNERLAAIADRVPGFAGIFYDTTGQLVVQLVQPQRLNEARNEVRNIVVHDGMEPEVIAERQAQLDAIEVRQARFSFRQLYDWHQMVKRAVIGPDGQTISWISSTQNSIFVGFSDSTQLEAIGREVNALALPDDAVRVDYFPGRFRNSVGHGSRSAKHVETAVGDPPYYLNQSYRPIIAGLQTSELPPGATNWCTLGFTADRSTDDDWYFVTAAHCTGNIGQIFIPQNRGQPWMPASIGFEVSDPPTFTNAQDSTCAPGRECRRSDVALFRFTNPNFTHARVAWPPHYVWQPLSFSSRKIITATGPAIEGQTVYKVGATTGRTSGTVINPCVNVLSELGVWILCQAAADYYSEGGDSGAPVVIIIGSFVSAVGVHQAVDNEFGLAVFSHMDQWMDEISQDYGGSFCVTNACMPPLPPMVVTITGPSQVESNWYCEWSASTSGGTPPYSYVWSGVLSGTGSTVFGNVSSSGQLWVTVTDSESEQIPGGKYITVSAPAPPAEGCFE